MRYAVIGYGRCGSLWTRDIIKFITNLPLINDDIEQWYHSDYPSILHTHKAIKVLELNFSNDCFVVLCIRRNSFDALVSLAVARHTDEWYFYTDKTYPAFYVDPEEFQRDIQGHRFQQNQLIETAQKYQIPHAICEFEELTMVDDPYEYVSKLIPYSGSIPDGTIKKKQNPRDYKKIINNYNELEKIWRSIQND